MKLYHSILQEREIHSHYQYLDLVEYFAVFLIHNTSLIYLILVKDFEKEIPKFGWVTAIWKEFGINPEKSLKKRKITELHSII